MVERGEECERWEEIEGGKENAGIREERGKGRRGSSEYLRRRSGTAHSL